jgi:hypothetical protein
MTKKSANSPKVLSVNRQDLVGDFFCQENQTTHVKDRKKVGAFVWIRGPKENPGQGTLIEGEDSVQLTSSLR